MLYKKFNLQKKEQIYIFIYNFIKYNDFFFSRNFHFLSHIFFFYHNNYKRGTLSSQPPVFQKMQSSFVCSVCSLTFVNKGRLDYHFRCHHQVSVTIAMNGQSRTIQRSSDEEFHCLKCLKSSRDPRLMFRHAKCFLDESSSNTVNTVPIPESSSAEEEVIGNEPALAGNLELSQHETDPIAAIHERLSRCFLAYDSSNKLMVCTKCPMVLGENFLEHSRTMHSKIVNPDLAEKISTYLPILSFQITLDFPIPAIPYLSIVQGFQCPTCHWCCANKKSMTEHYKSHSNNAYLQLSVQSVSRGCCLTFFPVVTPESPDSGETVHVEVQRIIEAVSSVARVPSLMPENDKTRNILYTTAGWFTDEMEFEDLKILDIHSYFECPVLFEKYRPAVEKYFHDVLASVGSWDVIHRMDLGRLDKHKPLMSLKTVDARKRYAAYWSELVFFALNVCTNGLQRYLTPSDAIRNVCGQLLFEFSETSLLELLRLLTHEKICGVQQTENLLPVFLRLTCLRKDYSLEAPEIVSQNGAKLQYLCRVVIYKCAELSGDKAQYLETNQDILDPQKHYVFSFLTITTGLAQKVNLNTKALPSLVVVEPGVSVLVRGSNVQLEKVVHCYAKCLQEVKRLVGLLKLGVACSVKLPDFVDDLSNQIENYSFHHRNSKVQRDLEEVILYRVLTEESLSEQYIAEKNSESLVWNIASARKYLEIYDKLMENLVLLVHLGSGMPARGSELSTYRTVNGKSSPRTVYILGDRVFFYCTYSKTN